MEFIKDNYKLTLEQDYEGIDIYLFDLEDDSIPLIYLKLKPLNDIDTELDDKTVIRDIPRNLKTEGDFYQSSVNKYNKTDKYKKISLLAIIHDILLENHHQILFLKQIFSSSLCNYKEEVFTTEDAKDFWFMQMNKKPNLPVNYFKKNRRFVLKINNVN